MFKHFCPVLNLQGCKLCKNSYCIFSPNCFIYNNKKLHKHRYIPCYAFVFLHPLLWADNDFFVEQIYFSQISHVY